MIVKVKEPQPQEYERFRPGQLLFTYLHLAADEALTRFLAGARGRRRRVRDRADARRRLPLLAPMSEIAGRMAPHAGASNLERPKGGRGVLMGGAAGVAPARVVVLGAGMAGTNAAWIAAGMEAEVTIVDKNVERLRFVDQIQRGRIQTVASSAPRDRAAGAGGRPGRRRGAGAGREGAAPGQRGPRSRMQPGAVLVDISIDQGGCFETSHVTTHSDPTYVLHGVVHYCVGNMPGAVPRTSTYALTNVTLPYVARRSRTLGLEDAVRADPALAPGVNVYGGPSRTPASPRRTGSRRRRCTTWSTGSDDRRAAVAARRTRTDAERFLDHLAVERGTVDEHRAGL